MWRWNPLVKWVDNVFDTSTNTGWAAWGVSPVVMARSCYGWTEGGPASVALRSRAWSDFRVMRAERRREKRDRYLDAAVMILFRDGFEGLTMSAIAREVEAAVGTIYGYFPSKSALVSELQVKAITTVLEAWGEARAVWTDDFASAGLAGNDALLAELLAYGAFHVQVQDVYPHDFRLQQMLLERWPELDDADAAPLLDATAQLLGVPLGLIERGAEAALFTSGERSRQRALQLTLGLAGEALGANVPRLLDDASVEALSALLTADLAVAWGAEREQVDRVAEVVGSVCTEHSLPQLPGHDHRRSREALIDLRDARLEAPAGGPGVGSAADDSVLTGVRR